MLIADIIQPKDQFQHHGVIGLAPGYDRNSLVYSLFDQKAIESLVISISLDDDIPDIIFGELDYSKI